LSGPGLQLASDQGKGLHHLVERFQTEGEVDVISLIVPNAVTIEELRDAEARDDRSGWIASLPAHPMLRLLEIGLEERWYSASGTPKTLAASLADHLRTSLEPLLPIYDVVLIDCPPYLSPLARAALSLADVFITPTMADGVSTWGTKQFSEWTTQHISTDFVRRNFVVITRFRNTRYARQMENELRRVQLADRWFGPTIPESVQILHAMERAAPDSYNTMRGKYAGVRPDVRRLAESFGEFLTDRMGAPLRPRIRD
ncbi:MAG: AAA family ATPase, partial [Pseudomonadota bacterium]